MTIRNSNVRLEKRRKEAMERQEEYLKLTIEEKILKLDRKLGCGIGAAKQRIKLLSPNSNTGNVKS